MGATAQGRSQSKRHERDGAHSGAAPRWAKSHVVRVLEVARQARLKPACSGCGSVGQLIVRIVRG
ncbi:hypothetical protein BRPE64_ACDS13330 [Caballeronia insecticola]|uniref:Uncharacterized protein n=1 Tax=Caballeronia insecticola TaxID=758793 RepID=R4WY48_9BURK|nr:hypothetical protein BRPE64_ACDS13330 [Caballeronia insecticola]